MSFVNHRSVECKPTTGLLRQSHVGTFDPFSPRSSTHPLELDAGRDQLASAHGRVHCLITTRYDLNFRRLSRQRTVIQSFAAGSIHDAGRRPVRGGLTAAGRAAFHRKDGSNLKPGVRKKLSEMTPTDMKRKGSWAVRFYGRKGKLPALTDAHGQPTRYALTAAAWGEPVPKTVAAARAIGAKGKRLLARAKKLSAQGR